MAVCWVFPDGSPTEQGVDHRQVQRELGEVSIYLQKPVVLSPSSARISWTVSRTLLAARPDLQCAEDANSAASIQKLCTLLFLSNYFLFFFFKVAHQSRYVQGFRIFYRTIGSPWLVQDVEATSDHSVIIVDLHSSTEYEVKIRPYFNELQGRDSLMVVLRTPEEGKESISVTGLFQSVD